MDLSNVDRGPVGSKADPDSGEVSFRSPPYTLLMERSGRIFSIIGAALSASWDP